MTSTIEPTADQQLKAKHRALWASGDYPSRGRRADPDARADPRRGLRRARRAARARRRRRVRQRRHPGRRHGRRRHRVRPDSRAVHRGPPDRGRSRASTWRGWRATPRRCRSPTRASTSCSPASGRCSRRTTRPSPTSWCAWSGPAAPIGMINWTPGRASSASCSRRWAPYAPPPPARRHAAAAVGRRAARPRPVRRPGHRPRAAASDHRDGPLRRTRPPSGSTGSATTARPSPCTSSTPRIPSGWLLSTATSSSSSPPGTAPTEPGRTAYTAEYLLVTARRR